MISFSASLMSIPRPQETKELTSDINFNKNAYWIAPKDCFTIDADVSVSSEYSAVLIETNATFYFNNNISDSIEAPAKNLITIPQGGELKFTSRTKCVGF
jgi:hypothetical protein